MDLPGSAPRRILVVDDEPMVRDSIRRILLFDRHGVETAACAREALAVFLPGKFDLILLDYEMPETNGEELAVAIRAFDPRQPIIMISAYAETTRITEMSPVAVDFVLSKPFNVSQLREAVFRFAILWQPGNKPL
jgi:CheY-like chemotaxis protein